MRSELKNIIKGFVPPGLHWLLRRNVFRGDFANWSDAVAASEGYDAGLILEKVRAALLKVKNGEAVYERDSALFDEVKYAWPLLTALLWIASQNGNRLNLIDYGGSLGSSYFQNRGFLSHMNELHWNIIEQPSFVECGMRDFEDDNLHFFHTIDECQARYCCDAILLSSVLPYLEQPHAALETVLQQGFEYIIIDRTPIFLMGDRDRLTVQQVPDSIYRASYPAWFFGRTKLLQHFEKKYEKIAEFDALAGPIRVGQTVAFDKGFVFKKIY